MYQISTDPPQRVRKRDGRLVPFDADKISRALFAAGESLGRRDAFLARELTDGVVHFLTAEGDEDTPTTARIAELVVKVVRELGQPALAEAFAACGEKRFRETAESRTPPAAETEVEVRFPAALAPAAALTACARSYSLQQVFARDLVAARADGLLEMGGLDHPGEIDGCVLGPRPFPVDASAPLLDTLATARAVAGRIVVVDSPEYVLAGTAAEESLGRELLLGLQLVGRSAEVHLNAATAPPWSHDLAGGPLFSEHHHPVTADARAGFADRLVAQVCHAAGRRVQIAWHVSADDFAPAGRARLERLARLALDGAPVAFVPDRPRRPGGGAEGSDRGQAAVLLSVGLHLPRLADQASVGGDGGRFLQKLPSLARLALSAGVQKRAFLRQLDRARGEGTMAAPALSTGFLLDRARLTVIPLGLEEIARRFTGGAIVDGGPATEFGADVIGRLRDVLRTEGRRALLETGVDAGDALAAFADSPGASLAVAMPQNTVAAVREPLRAVGAVHAAAGTGSVDVQLPAGAAYEASEIAECLRIAWQRTDVVRLRFVRTAGR